MTEGICPNGHDIRRYHQWDDYEQCPVCKADLPWAKPTELTREGIAQIMADIEQTRQAIRSVIAEWSTPTLRAWIEIVQAELNERTGR